MEQKKKGRMFKLVILILGALLAIFITIYMKKQVRPVISINGQKFWVGMTIQELVDEGFSVGLSAHDGELLNLDVQPQVPGETYNPKHYHIYKDHEFMMVDFSICNTNVDSCEFNDSRVYTFHYVSLLDFSGMEVLVNGINIEGMQKEEALNTFEKLGVKFDKKDKIAFLSGERFIIIGKSGDYSFELETYDDDEIIDGIRVRMSECGKLQKMDGIGVS